MSVADILEEVLQLPPSSRASLVEKIVESLAADIDPAVERSHLEIVAKRRKQASVHQNQILPGTTVLRHARRLIGK